MVWFIGFYRILVISYQIPFMYIYKIYMNYKLIFCSLTFEDKPVLTCLHTVILEFKSLTLDRNAGCLGFIAYQPL